MILTNQDIFDIVDALGNIKKSRTILNVKVGYDLAKIKQILRPYYEAIIETRKEKFLEHGDFDDKGEIIVAKDEIEALDKDLTELFTIENEVKLKKIKLKDLEDCNLEFNIIDGLMPIIE